jgi:type VI secretion system secreted protein Hcp
MKRPCFSIQMAEIGVIIILCASAAFAAFDTFLKVDGIPGESTDSAHKNWIEIFSYSFGATNVASRGTLTGAGIGKVSFSDLKVTKPVDSTSPKLFEACVTGKHIPMVTLDLEVSTSGTLIASGEGRLHMETIRLTNVFVTSFEDMWDTFADNDLPMERVTFTYGKIEWLSAAVQPTPTPTPTPTPIIGSRGTR